MIWGAHPYSWFNTHIGYHAASLNFAWRSSYMKAERILRFVPEQVPLFWWFVWIYRWWFQSFKVSRVYARLDMNIFCLNVVYWDKWRGISCHHLEMFQMDSTSEGCVDPMFELDVSTQDRLLKRSYWFCDRHSPSSIFMSGKAAYESVSLAFVLLVTGVLASWINVGP